MSTLLVDESPLQVLPSLAIRIGLNEAIILQQIHYWVSSKHNKNFFDGRHWVWNTYEQWQKQFCFLSETTIRRIIGNLEEKGIVISILKGGFQKVKYYTLDYDRLNEVLQENQESHSSDLNEQLDPPNWTDRDVQSEQVELSKMSASITEITSENSSLPPLTPPSAMSSEKKEDEDDLKKMILIWNEVVQVKVNPDQPVVLTEKRKGALRAFRNEVLREQGLTWETYCQKISRTRFLLGENNTGFKVNLDWSLIPDKAFKILEGAIYDKPQVKTSSVTREELLKELRESFPEDCLVSDWEKILDILMDQLDLSTIRSWFQKVGLVELFDGTAIIQVDTSFKMNWIKSHYWSELEKSVIAAIPPIKRVDLIWREQ